MSVIIYIEVDLINPFCCNTSIQGNYVLEHTQMFLENSFAYSYENEKYSLVD